VGGHANRSNPATVRYFGLGSFIFIFAFRAFGPISQDSGSAGALDQRSWFFDVKSGQVA
jgi:hypothetical protein